MATRSRSRRSNESGLGEALQALQAVNSASPQLNDTLSLVGDLFQLQNYQTTQPLQNELLQLNVGSARQRNSLAELLQPLQIQEAQTGIERTRAQTEAAQAEAMQRRSAVDFNQLLNDLRGGGQATNNTSNVVTPPQQQNPVNLNLPGITEQDVAMLNSGQSNQQPQSIVSNVPGTGNNALANLIMGIDLIRRKATNLFN